MTTHNLKCWPRFFQDIASGRLTFCMRKNDRGYAVGDVLLLREYEMDIVSEGYTGREEKRIVNYVMPGGEFGIDKDYCVLGLDDIAEEEEYDVD